jgi:hypothetical protein
LLKNIRKILYLATLLLMAAACSGGTSGSVSGTRQSCQSSGGIGTCEGQINKLSGAFTHKVKTDFYREGDPVFVEIDITVQSGELRLTIESPDGFVSSIQVSPGTTNKLTGIATVDSFMDEVYLPLSLEALNGDAEGLDFAISFSQP